MKEVNKISTQCFFQIILPMVSIFMIIGICGFLLISRAHHGVLNLHVLGNISVAFLLTLIIPSGMLILATLITLIYLTSKSFKWLRNIFQNIQSVFLRIDPTVTKICKTSAHPFILLSQFTKIFTKNKNTEG